MSTTRGIHNLASFWITQVPVVVVCTKMAEKRFAHLTEGEIEEKRSKIIPKSTLKANQKAARAFRQYLVEKEEADTQFEKYEKGKLADLLRKFYFDARKCDGDQYKTASMENLRHSL